MAAELLGGAFLSSFLGVLFDRLISPVVVNLIQGKKLSRKLVERLETTLHAARAVLNDAEQKQTTDHEVNKWLSNLKDAVYVADDLFDEVSTVAEIQKVAGNSRSHYLNLQDREIVNRMEDIIDTLESIVKQKDTLGLKEIPKENMSWRITTSLVKISDIYGRDNDKEAIIKLLLDDTSDDEISMIPIVGMGGIGKTTLAQLVYHDDEVKQNFDFQAWVCVYEEFDVIKVTRTIIEAITLCSCNMNDLNLLQHDLKEKLSRRKFLVVLDDAWNENYDDWSRLLKPFQHGVKGSKILITTRSRKVASVVQTVPPHELSLLSHEDCWLVFVKHALLSTNSKENPALEKLGREIASKCNGLPLAAKTLGGLLRGNYDVRYWNHILKSEIWELSKDRSKIISALRISYYYLPSYLKECFVYCSLYPKDYKFDKDKLILLWMAEDLLQPPKKGRTLEEIGCEYFDELVARSFFQPYSTNDSLFVMHDLMHDLATFYAGEFYFRAEELGDAAEIGIRTRHLSYNARGNYPISELLASRDRVNHTRTFLTIYLGQKDPFNMENAPCILLSRLKYLRVLSLKSFPLDQLPDSIGALIHLRYLDLSCTPIATLPESLSKLYNLQTLKLLGCFMLEMLPSGMQDLVNLRHLDISGTGLKEMPKGMSKLKHLQLLSRYIVGRHEENGIKELGTLANLHGSLSIDKLENVIHSGGAPEARMVDKKHIKHLFLSWWSSNGNIDDSQVERDILDNLQPHTDLKTLSIRGYGGTIFPNWLGHSSYHNMTELSLRGCRNCCMLPSLGQLPSLKSLSIENFDGLEIIDVEFYKNDESCRETPFPSLETLKFDRMSCWREWHSFELGAFPQLKELTISDCPALTRDLPNHLPALEILNIRGCKHLACSLPRTPIILELWITGMNGLRMQELPLSLHSLRIEGSQLVESMFEAITHTKPTCLQYLFISECSSTISFPGARVPASLQVLEIQGCKKLEFSIRQQHESLQSLTILDSCESLTSFPLEIFPNLKKLVIRKCENMKSLVVSQSQNAALSSLHSLTIAYCPSFVSFSNLAMAAPKLKHLETCFCPEIDSFPEGGLPPILRELRILECDKLVSCLATMDLHGHGLTHLDIGGPCNSVKSFPKEGWLPASLESLKLRGLSSLETLDCKGLLHLTSLQHLYIQKCPKLDNMMGERLPASLIEFFINGSSLLGERCQMKDPQIWPKISYIRDIKVNGALIW